MEFLSQAVLDHVEVHNRTDWDCEAGAESLLVIMVLTDYVVQHHCTMMRLSMNTKSLPWMLL